MVQVLEVILGSFKVAPIVGVDFGRESASGCESVETGQECLSGEVRDHLKACCLSAEAYEYGQVGLDENWFASMSLLQRKGSRVIDS